MRYYEPSSVEATLAGFWPSRRSRAGCCITRRSPPSSRRPCRCRSGWIGGWSRRWQGGTSSRSTPTRRKPGGGPGGETCRGDADRFRQVAVLLAATLQALTEDPTARRSTSSDKAWPGPGGGAGELTRAAGLAINSSPTTATPQTPFARRSVRRAGGRDQPGHAPLRNPPHHTKWFQLFEQLRIIVIDELHTYRGLFGSHVANVLRRLLRICAHYGSHPSSSAARHDREPAELARR